VTGKSRLAATAAVAVALLVALAAASSPSVLFGVEGGEWEISRAGAAPVKLCVANPETLAQFEHRNANCTRGVVRNAGTTATINYSCGGGGEFGHSTIKVITPRSLRIETQGISANAPFKYVLQARRVGNCPGH